MRDDALEIEREVVRHVSDLEAEVLDVQKTKDPDLETLKGQDLSTKEVDQGKEEEKKKGVAAKIVKVL